MVNSEYPVQFAVDHDKEQLYKAYLSINKSLVEALYKEIVKTHQTQAYTFGFAKGETPLYYIEQNYKLPIYENLQEFLFFHCVINSLYYEIHRNKIIVVGDPELRNICIGDNYNAQFEFIFTKLEPVAKQNWKNISFKAPERKNYKDLDRQVESFIKEEEHFASQVKQDTIAIGDWICFSLALIDKNQKPVLDHYTNILWLKIGDEEADRDTQEIFLGKNIGDTFYSQSIFLQNFISAQLDTHYAFAIQILDRVAQAYFSFEQFKKHFRTRSTREMHQKLIEVFSYRNDLSQRRETVEALFKLLNQQFVCKLPSYLVDQQQQMVLKAVHNNPDYHVYKSQTDFMQRVKQLAEKQLKQTIIIDHIAYQENIEVTTQDLTSYLNLTMRPRMKEFLYFNLPSSKIQGQEHPIPQELLKRYCLREKTLNYIIYHLTKKS
jgi:FKBP-type peptidyl-prolyl cis-trans isomerase (trigger factor)